MKEINKIIIGVVCTMILLIVMDRAVGSLSEKMYYKSQYGIFHRQVYCMNESKDEIVIIGSSRAAHHYVPSIIEDSLLCSCTNAGSDGMCIFYNYAILASYIHRNAIPSIVVCEVTHKDIEKIESGDFTLDAALGRMAPHYGSVPEIDSLFTLRGGKEPMKMMSYTYRYNSQLVQLLSCNYISEPEQKGYVPIYGKMNHYKNIKIIKSNRDNYTPIFDPLKKEYIIKLIKMCSENNIRLVFTYSPYYGGGMTVSITEIKKIANQYNVPFWDNSQNQDFQVKDLFRDESHMNDSGAKKYSRFIASKLKLLMTN